MPYSVRKADGLIWIRLAGEMTTDELLGMMDEIVAVEDANPAPIDRIADMTDLASAGISGDDLRLLTLVRQSRPVRGPTRLAIAAPGDAEFGFGRMYQMMNERPDFAIEVFRSMEAALAWLAEGKKR